MTLLGKITEVLKKCSFYQDGNFFDAPLIKKIASKIDFQEELLFILPAFPAKSSSPLKTSGVLPDLGEVLALQGLQNLCLEITQLYSPGARVIICSDGRVFSEVVKVSDHDIDQYQNGIKGIIQEFQLDRLSLFSLDDLYPGLNANELREKLFLQFAKTKDEVRNLVQAKDDFKSLFNGLHRFLLEDELAKSSKVLSKNKISKETKERTYELMRRSDAWSELLNHYYKNDLRLSIHPYHLEHEKFGINLIPSSHKWATPWHNVTVKIKDKFVLMHLSEAMERNAFPKLLKDKYAYFELTNA